MPDMTPVGNTIIPPDPSKSINTFSGILGLKQQQQALQSGALGIQQQQMQNQGTAISLGERMKIQQIMASGVDDQGKSILDDNGDPDPNKAMKWMPRVAPTTYPDYLAHVQQTETNKLGLKKSAAELGQTYRDQIGSILQTGVNDPGFNSDKARSLLTPYGAQNPDAAPAISQALSLLKNLDSSQDQGKKNDMLTHVIQAFKPSAANQAGTIDVGGSIQPGSVQPFTGKFTPTGGPIGKSLPPQIVSPPGGVPTQVGGLGGGVGGSGGKNLSGFPGPQPTQQDMDAFGKYNENLNHRVSIASDSIPRIQMAEHALENIRAGAGAESYVKWAQRLQAIGASPELVDAVANGNLAKAQEAEKLLFQTTFSGLRQSMQGDRARVSEFEAASKVFPSIGTDPRATKEILGFMMDQGKRDYSEQQALTQARKEGTFNPVTWQGDYQQQLRAGKVPGTPESQVPSAGGGKGQGKTVVRTGKLNGRRVAEYSDGTHGYID